MKCPKCGSIKYVIPNVATGCKHIAYCIKCETRIFIYSGKLFDHQLTFKEQKEVQNETYNKL